MMKEREPIKINLSTFFLIMAVIIIILMGMYIYKLSNEKTNEQKVANVSGQEVNNSENKNEKNTTNEFANEQKADNVSEKEVTNAENKDENTIPENTDNDEKDSKNESKSNKTTVFTDKEIKESIQNYLHLVGVCEGSPYEMLEMIDLSDTKEYDDSEITDDYYKETNIKYSTFKKKMLNYMTEECLKEFSKHAYKNIDGYLYCFDGGGSGNQMQVDKIKLKDSNSDSVYIAEVYSIAMNGSKSSKPFYEEFGIENNNGKCVISYCK